MNRLADLPVERKRLLLKIFVAVFTFINIAIFLQIYRSQAKGSPYTGEYEQMIKKYLKAYQTNENRFEEFSFY